MDVNRYHQFIKQETKHKGDFLEFHSKHYDVFNNGQKQEIIWECVSRKNKLLHRRVGATEVIPLIKNTNKIILIENHRYAVDKNILEFPSGLIDLNEWKIIEGILEKMTEEKDEAKKLELEEVYDKEFKKLIICAGERELKEETGYSGIFKTFLTPPNVDAVQLFENVYHDPWKSSENCVICVFEVDKSIEANKNPIQSLDETEFIKVHEVELDNLLKFIIKKVKDENCGCTSHLYTLAIGMQFNSIINK